MVTEAKEGLPQTALISLSDFMAEKLPADEEKEKINPVGIILYAGKSKMAMIGSRTDEQFQEALVCSYQDTPQGFDPSQVFDGKNRIISLSDYEQLRVLQVSIGGVEIHTFRSIRTLPSVNVTIRTHNPVSKQAEVVNVDEIELLKLFTREAGGIAVFSGADLPEENALVLERDIKGSKSGLALFMYPDTDPISAFDSVTGLYSFVKALNQEFIDTPRYPLQTEALAAFNRGLRTGEYDFGGIEVREELFRSLVIAHTRLAARLREPQHQEFLKLHLPNLGTPEWARFFRRLLMRIGIKDKDLQLLANRSIDRLILGEQIPEDQAPFLPAPSRKETDEDFLLKLKTPEARDIWHTVGHDYKDDYHGRRWTFVVDIVHFIQDAETLDPIEDSLVSLQRLEESVFRKINIAYYVDKTHHRISFDSRHSYSDYTGLELIQYLRVAVLEKKKLLETQMPQSN